MRQLIGSDFKTVNLLKQNDDVVTLNVIDHAISVSSCSLRKQDCVVQDDTLFTCSSKYVVVTMIDLANSEPYVLSRALAPSHMYYHVYEYMHLSLVCFPTVTATV